MKQAAADQHGELSAGTRDRDVETLRRKYEISLGQGEFGIGDAIGQYDCVAFLALNPVDGFYEGTATQSLGQGIRSEEHTSELQSLMRTSYAVFCLKKKIKPIQSYYIMMKANNARYTTKHYI